MKALSLWQPWASAVAMGSKKIETRSWYVSYRGPLAIHAAKHKDCEINSLLAEDRWKGALWPIISKMRPGQLLQDVLPFGAIVAVCRLYACYPVHELEESLLNCPHQYPTSPGAFVWAEMDMGDFSPGRFGWVLQDIRPLPEPVTAKGMRGLFEVDGAFAAYLPPEVQL